MQMNTKYTIVLCYDFSNKWLDMTRVARKAFENEHVLPIFKEFSEVVEITSYDAESFETEFTDFMIMRTTDIAAYYHLIETLRDSPLMTQGLCTIRRIIIGLEDGFREYEAAIEKEANLVPAQ